MSINFTALKKQIEQGIIDPVIFLDEEIYRLELERVWKRSWVFVGHESMITKPGDYITSYIGEDPVIVSRDKGGKLHVMLNSCRHRGVKLCPFDRGNAKTFSCVYHGWVYGNDGALINVPEFEQSYEGVLDKKPMGLIEVPQVASYGGFVFANWDAGAISLEKYLGDFRYYFDNTFGRLYAGEVEMSAIKQRVRTSHNWKVPVENGSDMYHVSSSHAGSLQTLIDLPNYLNYGMNDMQFLATVNENEDGIPSHTLLAQKVLNDTQAYDVHIAERFGAESVDYVKHRYQMMEKLDQRVIRGGLSVATLFPSMIAVDTGPLAVGVSVELVHPKGPRETETWLYVYVEKDAPSEFKRFAAQQATRFHSFTGSIVPPDHENWERLDQGVSSTEWRGTGFNYNLGRGGKGGSPAFVAEGYDQLPGTVEYAMSERGSRSFYRHWINLMQET